jgi:hypothetical protein
MPATDICMNDLLVCQSVLVNILLVVKAGTSVFARFMAFAKAEYISFSYGYRTFEF